MFRGEIVALSAIATNGDLTDTSAGVSGVSIAVIASLLVLPNHAVTAGGGRTGTQTLIAVDVIAVITKLTGLEHAVTATRRLTVVAFIGGVIVGVITAFTRTDHAIAASRFDAG